MPMVAMLPLTLTHSCSSEYFRSSGINIDLPPYGVMLLSKFLSCRMVRRQCLHSSFCLECQCEFLSRVQKILDRYNQWQWPLKELAIESRLLFFLLFYLRIR